MTDTINKKDLEKLTLSRNSIMSPYVAMGWDIKADFPTERKIILKKNRKFSFWICLLWGFWNVFILSAVYIGYWYFTREEEKILLY